MALQPLPSDLTNGPGLLEGMAYWASVVTQGWYWAMALFGFCVVLMIGTTKFGMPRSFGFASFVGALGATMLAILNLLPWSVASMFIITGFVGFAVMILNER